MRDDGARRSDRLGPFAVLGAWLGLWTPPRDAVVPPVPWRSIAAIAAALLIALTGTALLVLPGVAERREAARERQERAEAARHARFLEYVDREQRPRRGRGPQDPGGAGAQRVAARARLVRAAGARIEADAGTRTRKRILGVRCEPFPRTLGAVAPAADLARAAATYDCVAVTSRLPDREGVIGMPFRLRVDFRRGRFAWCRIVPLGDRDRLTHPLPAACRLP